MCKWNSRDSGVKFPQENVHFSFLEGQPLHLLPPSARTPILIIT